MKENQRPAFGMLVPLMLTIVITRIAGSLVFPTYDDAFITYRYARNLVHGIGFVYNRGEQILGVTAPLFAAVPALLELLHVPVPLGMLLVNICCDVVSLYLVSRLIDLRRSALMLMLFGLLLAVSPVLVRIAVGGMEANLFIVLFLTAIVLITRDWIACGLFVAVCACWMRPEGLMLLAVVSLYSLWQQPRRTLIAQFFLVVPVLLVPAAVLINKYGSIVPQSVAAKSAVHSSFIVVLQQLVWPDPVAIAVLPLAAWGLTRLRTLERGLQLLTAWGLLYLSAYLVMRPGVWSWYAAPTQFVLMILAAVGASDLVSRATTQWRELTPLRTAAAGVGVALVWVAALSVTHGRSATGTVYGEMRQWAMVHHVEQNTVLAEDIGAIGYYSDAYILDAAGLVYRDRAKFDSVKAMIIATAPRYVMINVIRDQVAMMGDFELRRTYRPVARFPRTDQPLNPDPRFLSPAWRQEYLIYERQ